MPGSAAMWLLAMSVVVAACAQRVVSEVQVFHELERGGAGETIAVLPADDRNWNSLEYQAYARKLAGHLKANGYAVIGNPARAELIAYLGYGSAGARSVSRTRSTPQWGETGTAFSRVTSDGTVSTIPEYGIVGYTTYTTTRTVYDHVVSIDIISTGLNDNDDYATVYEARLASSGACASLADVINEILAAAFADFPGPSGQGRTVSVIGPSDC